MLDEAPDSLLYSAIDNFETQPDVASLQRISENLKKTAELRRLRSEAAQKEVDRLEADLAQLSREIAALKQPGTDVYATLGVSDKNDDNLFRLVDSKSAELDKQKVALAKQLTELESAINQMTMATVQMSRQRDELARKREQALAANVAANMNSSSMKISLYKSLGVHIEAFGDSDRILLFDRATELTSVLPVDEKYLDYFISNYIWDRLGNV